MELFIKILNGQPFEHPILGDNFRQAFPHIDVNNLPPDFAKFIRVDEPIVGVYQIADGPTYEWDNNVVKDVWTIREMTEEEKENKNIILTTTILERIETLKDISRSIINNDENTLLVEEFTKYLNLLDHYKVLDPSNPQIPILPKFDENGNLLSNNSQGNPPNVVG